MPETTGLRAWWRRFCRDYHVFYIERTSREVLVLVPGTVKRRALEKRLAYHQTALEKLRHG